MKTLFVLLAIIGLSAELCAQTQKFNNVILTTLNGTSPSAFGLSLWDDANAGAARATLGLDAVYQPLDAELTSWAAVARGTGFDLFTATYPNAAGFVGLASTVATDTAAISAATSFAGSAVQPVLLIETPSGYAGDYLRARLNNVEKFSISQTGKITTAATTISFAGVTITPARTDAAQTFTGTNTFGAIDATSIGATERGTGLFTTLGANGATTLGANATFSNTGEGIALHGGGTITGASGAITAATSGATAFTIATNGSSRWNVSSAGHLLANTTNVYDIGASAGNRPRHIYIAGEGITCLGNIEIDNTVAFYWSSRCRLRSSGTGTVLVQDSSDVTFATLSSSGNIFTSTAVIGGTTINANAVLDVQSTTKAFIPPRMTTTQRDAIASPTAGMVIYNSTTNKLNVYTTAWEAVTSS